MTDALKGFRSQSAHGAASAWAAAKALRTIGPPLLFGIRMWASVCLALYLAFWLQLDNPFWAGTSAAIVCQPQLGASLRKGWFRMIGTCVGAVMTIVLTACFPQDRILFLGGLALWGAACAFAATLLRNFAAYAAALAGYTVAIVGGDLLGAVGGVDANAAFLLAVARATEICIGIVCAGMVLSLTDLAAARRRLAAYLAELAAGISAGFARTLASAGSEVGDPRPVGREFAPRVAGLDPLIDQTIGESSEIRLYSPVLQSAMDGLFAALAGWRAVADRLASMPRDDARRAGAALLRSVPPELRAPTIEIASTRWIADPSGLHGLCETAARELIQIPEAAPSRRLLADQTADALTGLADALNGLALLETPSAGPVAPARWLDRPRAPDWLPALVNSARAFVTIAAVSTVWIVTAWPGGAVTITFAAVTVILLGLRAEQAFAATLVFSVGVALNIIVTAIVAFAVLPRLETETFFAFSLVIGACLVPIGALLAGARKPWQIGILTAMSMTFVPLLHPSNQMVYNAAAFYNGALAILVGCVCGALSFRLMPTLSPAFRARRLLVLTLRDVRRLATGPTQGGKAPHAYDRLSAVPDAASLAQRTQLAAALLVGREMTRLREIAKQLGIAAELEVAFAAFARGDSAASTAQLVRLDAALALRSLGASTAQDVPRARGCILALIETLSRHGNYFDHGDH